MENVAVVLALTRIGHVTSRFDAVLATMWLDMSVLKESRGRKEKKRDIQQRRGALDNDNSSLMTSTEV